MKLSDNIKRLKRWVVRHRNFAIALPLILMLTSFFVIENVKDFHSWPSGGTDAPNGFNPELPGKVPTLESRAKDGSWKIQDSLETERVAKSKELPEMTSLDDSENDSLRSILKRLEGLSLESNPQTAVQVEIPDRKKTVEREKKTGMTAEERKQKFVENRLAYREMLLEGKKKIIGESLAGNRYPQREAVADNVRPTSFRTTVYGDQFILPNENVRLLLMEDMVLGEKRFPKNTFIYALASIQGNRVYLEIDNIEHHPVNIAVRDFNDGREGIYNKRAGELWREYKAEIGGELLRGGSDEITNGAPGILKGVVQGLGTFLRKKRLREKERILLIDDYELLLVTQ
ncbi:conjugative transposon protein TraM [Pseudozobellia sp. WGM2]|uniref:conjugative transposon protein TraM n=1 Tax=Pseudozobellia sp. WGM2 TaxID=2787625 RepID=UPI001AE02D0C|nr:conjugative transposon protein TraM [Pseudozobellia sp. WGM2]